MLSTHSIILKFILSSAIFHYYYDSIHFNKLHYKVYDFIVIGGGTSGALIASRLSENPRFKILLLERGGSAGNYFTDIPFVANVFSNDKTLTKLYETVPQKNACLSSDGRCKLYTGHGFGGGSSHNQFLYVRGSPLDFNHWQSLYGAINWSYQNVLPYFKSTELCLNTKLAKSGLRGTTPGALLISTPASKDYSKRTKVVLEALSEYGYKIGDYNGRNNNVFGVSQISVGHGKRSSSWTAFLKPVIKRTNLDVISFAHVTKINFENKRAVSVSYTKGGTNRNARVENEVIVSAGAVDTPKILMLSGIGDEEELSKLGIEPIVSNLPSVGKSFMDHTQIIIPLTTNFEPFQNISYRDYEQYEKTKKGILATDRGSFVVGFLTDEEVSINGNDTRFEYDFVGIESSGSEYPNGDIFVQVYLTVPQSRGSIKLKSVDPFDDPLVDPNYLGTKEDFEMYKKGIKNLFTFVNQSIVFQTNRIRIKEINIPGCGILNENSSTNDTFLDCFIRSNTVPGTHIGSSCRMGQPSDPMACVDPRLKLLGGIKNVRIMDASIMPQITRGNTNAPTTMIAEKGVRMLLDDFGSRNLDEEKDSEENRIDEIID